MRYSGIQPQYFPRLHYFARVLNADIFVIRDDVQFVRKHRYPDGSVGKSYQVHTPFKQPHGLAFLTVPVQHDGRKSLAKTEISYKTAWTDDHLKTVLFAYRKAPNFETIQNELTSLLSAKYKTLAELNTATILWGILKLLGEKSVSPEKLTTNYVEAQLNSQTRYRLKKIILESDTKAAKRSEAKKNERIIELCKEFGATEDYCGGTAAAAYVDPLRFKKEGIKITVQDWKIIEYHQQFKKNGFIGNLSIIDLLMNTDQDIASKIITGKPSHSMHASSPLLYIVPSLDAELFSIFTDVMRSGVMAL